jgi:hypothetical protein
VHGLKLVQDTSLFFDALVRLFRRGGLSRVVDVAKMKNMLTSHSVLRSSQMCFRHVHFICEVETWFCI